MLASDGCSVFPWKKNSSLGLISACTISNLRMVCCVRSGSALNWPSYSPCSIRPIFCDPRSNCIQPFSRVAGSIAIETLTISGGKTTVVVPIAIVLVPFPGSTLLRLLQDNLAVIVIHFVVKHAFYRCDDSITTADFTADIVTRVVPRCELHRISIRVDMV